MSFGEEWTRTDRPNFPPQSFPTKAIYQQESQDKEDQNDGFD
jgi:hypothetical protein